MNYHMFPSSYDWASMSANWGTPETARLMSDIGNQVNMSYGCNGSSARGLTTVWALTNFGYTGTSNMDFSGPGVSHIVKNEIVNRRPVIMVGSNAEGTSAHEWVSDGYQNRQEVHRICVYKGRYGLVCDNRTVYNSYFHMDWGWDGYANGWFHLGNIHSATYGFNFNYNNELYYNITQ